MIKIMMADDHYIVRKGLRTLLGSTGDFVVVSEASDGFEAVKLAEELKPDVLILDLMMPGMSGFEVAHRLTKVCPQIRIVILSMHCNEAYVYEAFRSGARAYVLKDNIPDELITAIRQVNRGSLYLSSSLRVQAGLDLQNK